MISNEGIIQLHKVLKSMNNKAINYDKGLGTFDIAEINASLEMKTEIIARTLKPGEYLVSKNLLEQDCEVDWTEVNYKGEYVKSINTKLPKKFNPGTYLICYLNNVPVVLCELVRGDQVG